MSWNVRMLSAWPSLPRSPCGATGLRLQPRSPFWSIRARYRACAIWRPASRRRVGTRSSLISSASRSRPKRSTPTRRVTWWSISCPRSKTSSSATRWSAASSSSPVPAMASPGPYNTRLFQKLGIYDQIKDKIKIIQGKPVAVAVADGEVEIGIQQTNVIQPVAGTQYLGPLPPDLIEYGHFGVAVRNVSKNQDVARELIKFMTSPEAAALLRKTAMEPPER
ncbi:MAG: hypothetical protein DMG12_28010 [Acidobacteria bacterium]|nr:MAG: hypothetical protein DMG12_28010 [Acidobacteriota bacterium]